MIFSRHQTLGCGAALFTSLVGQAHGQLFGGATSVAVGPNPHAIAVADVSGDGRPDLVVAVFSANRIAVLLGTGGGGFAPAVNHAVGTNPESIAIGDLNQDRLPDLVTTTANDTVSILFGTGSGGFAPATNLTVGPVPVGAAIGDLNGDGRPDLAVVNLGTTTTQPSTVAVLLGNGAGGFGAPASFNVASGAREVVLGDLNQDGRLDAVTANFSSRSLSVVLGDGAGGFGPPTDYATPSFLVRVALADLSGDGRLDLIGAGSAATELHVFFNTGGATFGARTGVPAGSNASAVAAADVNRDGTVDLIALDAIALNVSVMVGTGGGSFAAPVTFAVGSGPRHLAVSDVDGDGTTDVAVANNLGGSVSVLLGRPVTQGARAYGDGTAGFHGALGANANVAPRVNTPGFRLAWTNAPRRAAGTVLLGNVADPTGSLLFGLGLRFHVSASSSFLLTLGSRSDEAGVATTPLPIPPNGALQGLQLFAQSVWVENVADGQASSRAASGLVGSRGLEITLLP